jgi:hypothetical protein
VESVIVYPCLANVESEIVPFVFWSR